MQRKVWALFLVIGLLLFSMGSGSALTLSEGDGLWLRSAQLDESILFSTLATQPSDDPTNFVRGSEILLTWLFGRFQHRRGHRIRHHWEPQWCAQLLEASDCETAVANTLRAGATNGPGPGERAPAPVPEPATMLLLGTGLLMCAAFSRKRSKRD